MRVGHRVSEWSDRLWLRLADCGRATFRANRCRPMAAVAGSPAARASDGGVELAVGPTIQVWARRARSAAPRWCGRPRHALATTIVTRDPRDLEVASAALAHRGTTRVSRVYDRSGAAAADAAWKRLLRKRKRRAKPS
jgi:hypothetical protein